MPILQWIAVVMALGVAGALAFFFGGEPEAPLPPELPGSLAVVESEPVVIPSIAPAIADLIRPDAVEDLPDLQAPTASSSTGIVTSVPEPVPAPEPEHFPSPVAAVEELSSTLGLLRGALVNIICIPEDDSLRSISGTGIMIDSRGIILTVAHVGQYFLLRDAGDGDIFCVVRTGSPAKNAYEAELAYISPEWVIENPTTLTDSHPTGTGEHDFALLAVTDSATKAPLPSSFDAVPLAFDTDTVSAPDAVAVGSYGAEFLDSSQVRSYLYPTIVFGEIRDVYTFGVDTLDLFSVGVGATAQQGSSGGGVLNADDELIGLITTRTSRADLSLRNLNVITLDHIRRSFEEDSGEDLESFLAHRTPISLVRLFEPRAEALAEILKDSIESN